MKSSHKNGFTLIELLIGVAIISTLGAVGTPMYQGYLTSTKENTAKDNLTTIAFMQSDHNREFGKYLPCPKKTLNTAQIDSQLLGSQGDLSSGDYSYKMTGGCSDFNALALTSNPKAKCFKVDSSRTISTITCPKSVTKIANCTLKSGTRISGGSTGKVVSCNSGQLVSKSLTTKNFNNYKPPSAAIKGNGSWTMVDSNGKQVKGRGGTVCSMSVCGPGGSFYKSGSGSSQHGQVDPSLYKYVFEQPAHPTTGNVVSRAGNGGMTYNFSTGVWTTKNGSKYDTNGNLIKTRKSFETYKPPAIASKGNGVWAMVDSNGIQVKGRGRIVCSMSVCGPGGSFYKSGSSSSQHGQVDPDLYKYVFETPRMQPLMTAGPGLLNSANGATGDPLAGRWGFGAGVGLISGTGLLQGRIGSAGDPLLGPLVHPVTGQPMNPITGQPYWGVPVGGGGLMSGTLTDANAPATGDPLAGRMTYNFSTGVWTTKNESKYDTNGNLIKTRKSFETYKPPAIASKGNGVWAMVDSKSLTTKNFNNYKPPSAAIKGNGSWTMVDSNGKQVKDRGGTVCSMSVCGPGGSFYKSGSGSSQHGQVDPSLYKYVFEQPAHPTTGNVVSRAGNGGMSYNFSTGVWTTKSGQKFDSKGNRVK